MLVVTIYGDPTDQKFVVHRAATDGSSVADVTGEYEVRALNVQDGEDVVEGWHVGTRRQVPTLDAGTPRGAGKEL